MWENVYAQARFFNISQLKANLSQRNVRVIETVAYKRRRRRQRRVIEYTEARDTTIIKVNSRTESHHIHQSDTS